MSTLMQVHHQWATRPSDERYTSLYDMLLHFNLQRDQSKQKVVSSRTLEATPDPDNKGLYVVARGSDQGFAPTHWAFGQLAQLAGAPPGYLRSIPSPLAADCLNYGLHYARDIEDVGLLLHSNGSRTLRAATGPKYGRIWNDEILKGMCATFGDGVTGDWRVPGVMGRPVAVTKENTTLYAGDRDMFVFLADEQNRIEVPGRRDGQTGSMARGVIVSNSEVGSASFRIAGMLFDYLCQNRIIWGVTNFQEITLRHTASAPDRFFEQMQPALKRYSEQSTVGIVKAIEQAKKSRLEDVDKFLSNRFSKQMVERIQNAHVIEEGRPIESLWDVATGITATAKSIQWQDERTALERKAGEILDLAK